MPGDFEAHWRARLTGQLIRGKADLQLVAELPGTDGPSQVVGHVGRALMNALLDYADRWPQVLRVALTVFTDNQRAVALYHSCGFETEGRLKGYALRDGHYVDVYTMARWHPDPPQLRAAQAD